MSRRTSEANRAIAKSWENEKNRVLEGKGTRNWTPEQQRDILDTGKAYDENGRAFEGHHMKSVEAYPQYQGDPENIQFLNRAEHKAAHFGDFHTPTNGFYDPVTGETIDFGDGPYMPCKVITLENPIILHHTDDIKCTNADTIDQETSVKAEEIKAESKVNVPLHNQTRTTPVVRNAPTGLINKARSIAKSAVEFIKIHPGETIELIIDGICIAVDVKNKLNNKKTNKDVRTVAKEPPIASKSSSEELRSMVVESLKERETRSSPVEHTVQAHRQRYGKDKVWKDKSPYSRGGKKNT